jgi:hypothetical protein
MFLSSLRFSGPEPTAMARSMPAHHRPFNAARTAPPANRNGNNNNNNNNDSVAAPWLTAELVDDTFNVDNLSASHGHVINNNSNNNNNINNNSSLGLFSPAFAQSMHPGSGNGAHMHSFATAPATSASVSFALHPR